MDAKLEAFAYVVARRKWIILAVLALFIVALVSQLPKTTVDTTTEGFLHESDPTRITYDAFRAQFGRDEKLVVAIQTDDVFSEKNLQRLKALHEELSKEVPFLNDITSLVNARNTRGSADALIVEDLMQTWPQDEVARAQLKKLALANPMYENILVSSDATMAVIIMESQIYSAQTSEESLESLLEDFDAPQASEKRKFLTDKENSHMVAAVQAIVERHRAQDFELFFAGSPTVTAFLKSSMMKDMAKFNGLIVLTIVIFLSLLFKRASGVVLPLVAVILAIASTLGLMALTHTPIKTITQILPSFLLAVGVGASVHVLAIFYKKLDATGDKVAALAYTLRHSGVAIMMTSLTTAAGLASFSFSQVAPVADLGMFASTGVMISLLYTLVLLPTLLMIVPTRVKHVKAQKVHHDWMDVLLHRVALFSHTYARSIVIVSVLFMLLVVGLATQIRYSHNPLMWFKPDHSVRQATERIDAKMQGSISLELIIDTHKTNGLYDYEMLKSIEALSSFARTLESDAYFVGKSISVVDIIKEIHKALNENKDAFYAIPQDAKLIAQEILLFENSGSDDLEDVVDSQFSKARITMKVPWIEAFAYHDLLDTLHAYVDAQFQEGVSVTMTGMIPLLAETISAAITSSGESYMLAFGVIALMMMVLLSSVLLGLISMLPNVFPVVFTLAVMVVFDLPLDLFTMLIGSIVIGIAVDDNIHFMHNFRRHYLEHGDAKAAIDYTLLGTGRAMTVTTIVLSIGFFVYMFASMNNLFSFGLLTGLALVVALLADIILAPALMTLYYKKGDKK